MWSGKDDPWTGAAGAAAVAADAPALHTALLLRVLDEIDHGVLVLDAHARIVHHNHLARHELGSGRVLVAHGQVLLGSTGELTAQIDRALSQAGRGQRRLELLQTKDHELTVSFIPLSHPLETDSPLVLLMLSRQGVSDNLAVRMYARGQGLSPAEEAVLIGLGRGLSVPDIARENGVAESTVRSQVKSLREKTRATSIRQLMVRINSLPPVVPALRALTPLPHNAGETFPS